MKICSDSASAIKRKQGSAEKVDDKIQSIENELQIKLESVQKKADRINLMEQEVKQLEQIIDSERGKYILYLGRPTAHLQLFMGLRICHQVDINKFSPYIKVPALPRSSALLTETIRLAN